jgi:hypothetical protein
MVSSIDTRTSVMVGTVQDITERKRADEALKEINLLNQLELAVREVLATQTSLPTALQECCAVVVRALDGAFAGIWTLNQSGAVLDLQASAGLYTHIDGSHRQVPVGQSRSVVLPRKDSHCDEQRIETSSTTRTGRRRKTWSPLPGIPCWWRTGYWG